MEMENDGRSEKASAPAKLTDDEQKHIHVSLRRDPPGRRRRTLCSPSAETVLFRHGEQSSQPFRELYGLQQVV